jgi:hypothetical protein
MNETKLREGNYVQTGFVALMGGAVGLVLLVLQYAMVHLIESWSFFQSEPFRLYVFLPIELLPLFPLLLLTLIHIPALGLAENGSLLYSIYIVFFWAALFVGVYSLVGELPPRRRGAAIIIIGIALYFISLATDFLLFSVLD